MYLKKKIEDRIRDQQSAYWEICIVKNQDPHQILFKKLPRSHSQGISGLAKLPWLAKMFPN